MREREEGETMKKGSTCWGKKPKKNHPWLNSTITRTHYFPGERDFIRFIGEKRVFRSEVTLNVREQ